VIEARPNADIANRTPQKWKKGRTFRLFGDEHPLEGSNVMCLESRRDTSMETPRIDRCIGRNNSYIVILTGVSTVITDGSLSSNARGYMRRNTFAKSVSH
jgi:hypothetical protein